MKFFAFVLLVAAASGAVKADLYEYYEDNFNCSESCPCPRDIPVGCPADLESSLLKSVNKLRLENGLSPLAVSPKINQYSQVWANYLAARNIYYHEAINKYGSDLIYSYRVPLNREVSPVSGDEAVNFWINTNGIAARAGNEFENNLDNLFDPRSESIGFGCALTLADFERANSPAARSYESQSRYFVVANIEVNPNKKLDKSCYYHVPQLDATTLPPTTLLVSSENPSSSYPSSLSPSSQYPSSLYASSISPSTNPSSSPSSSPSPSPSTSLSTSPSTLAATPSSTTDLPIRTKEPLPVTLETTKRPIPPQDDDDEEDDGGLDLRPDSTGSVFAHRPSNKTVSTDAPEDLENSN